MTFKLRPYQASFAAAVLAARDASALDVEPENVDELLRKSRPLLVNPSALSREPVDFSGGTCANPPDGAPSADYVRAQLQAAADRRYAGDDVLIVSSDPRNITGFAGGGGGPGFRITVGWPHEQGAPRLIEPLHRAPEDRDSNPHKAHLATGAQWKRERGRRR